MSGRRTALALALLLSSPAAADEPPAAADEPDAPPAATARRARRFSFKSSLGASYRDVYGLPVGAAATRLSFGRRWREVAAHGAVDVRAGATPRGRPLTEVRVGGTVESASGRFRIGGGLGVGWLLLNMITSGEVMVGGTLGLEVFGSVDLVASARHALYLEAGGGLDVLISDGMMDDPAPAGYGSGFPLSATARLGLGYRY